MSTTDEQGTKGTPFGLFLSLSREDIAVGRPWCFHEAHEDCHFDRIGYGEVLYALQASGQGYNLNSLQGEAYRNMTRPWGQAPVQSGTARIRVESGETVELCLLARMEDLAPASQDTFLHLTLRATTFATGPQIFMDGLLKTLMAAEETEVLGEAVPFEIRTLDFMRSLFKETGRREFVKAGGGQGVISFKNIHVVIKFTTVHETLLPHLTDEYKVRAQSSRSLVVAQARILEEGLMSDFTILAGGRAFPSHKLFLAVRSPVFSRMFESGMLEVETGTLRLEDTSPKGVQAFLAFIYTGALDGLLTSPALTFEMLRMGHKYEILGLEEMAHRLLHSLAPSTFTAPTAFDLYSYGVIRGHWTLRDKAVRVLQKSAERYLESGEMEKLRGSLEPVRTRKIFWDWISDAKKP